ncbi:DUF2637 domain-containing protein [Streptomyces sp. DSM 41527]|uniref:DUF2637 domain-containing protein n=1 Tax=Streptomyces mooreae TaxID=3075523 RepID=A0ABU2T355_9ACTN|nr:DUF2637 domain-containing protein [Streptomyces sp. DSM 41527]MDT0455542.1 DUF2637 domain-containing protein [Streptomyces sp. DSM 41527]
MSGADTAAHPGTSTRVEDRSTGVNAGSTPVDIGYVIAVLAGALTALLTAAAFWLSYEHLQEVAARHGMADATARSWAWPATVDLFIVIGELLILRASLAHRVDGWAILLTAAGSGGSIALNVAGVGDHAQGLDYVVAAVPPVAALLAFGALMRQVHAYLAARLPTPVEADPTLVDRPSTPVTRTVDEPSAPVLDAAGVINVPVPEPMLTAAEPEAPSTSLDTTAEPDEEASTPVDLCTPVIYPNRVDQLIRALYGTDFTQPNTARMTEAMAAAGLGSSESTARTARSRVRTREPRLAAFPTAIAS